MSKYDPSRQDRRRWWRDYLRDEHAADEASFAQLRQHLQNSRPPWWPENEPWPPHRRHWTMRTRRPFFRRLGCLFLLFNLLGAFFFVGIVVLVLNGLGVISTPVRQVQWIVPAAGVAVAITITLVIIAGANLRRMSMPLDELLAASRSVAEGDYTVRVTPRGPSEVRSLATAFNSMAAQLDAHDRQRRSMLADVTHELRTPLTVIQGNLEGMLDGMYQPDEIHLRSILEETQVLSRLTEDLRTLSLAESGSLQLRPEPTDLVALARDTLQAHQSQADAAGVTLDLIAGQPEILHNADAERLRQVLSNLLSNAIRYSPRNSRVQAKISREDGVIRVSVEDSGPGIPASDLPHVFDRYYRSADSRGMGLGLSIARYLVEAHGGQIGAESSPGKGTTIWFTLPA